MQSYYVSPVGADSNPGTIDRPFKTIQTAIAQTVGESRTIHLRGGTYDLNEGAQQQDQVAGIYIEGQWQIGSESDFLKIQAYQDEKPVLDGRQLAYGLTGIFIKDVQNVEIKGLELHSVRSNALEVVNGKNIDINSNIVHSNQGSGIGVRGYLANAEGNGETAGRSENVRIEGNLVYRNMLRNSGAREGQQNWGGAVYVRHAAQAKVANNSVYENYGEGIIALQSRAVAIDNNTVYDNYSVNVYLDNASDSTVQNNFIYTTDNEAFFREIAGTAYPASNIGFANEVYDNVNEPWLYYLNNIDVTNNVLVGGQTGLYYGTYSGNHSYAPLSQKGLKNIRVVNNTIYNPQTSFVRLDTDPAIENVEFSNNIFAQSDQAAQQLDIASSQGVSFTHNLWDVGDRSIYSARGYTAEGDDFLSADDVLGGSGLVNPGGLDFWDYQLQPDSPAIDAAKVVTGVTDNAIGQPDIGAIEFQGTASLTPGLSSDLSSGLASEPASGSSGELPAVLPVADPLLSLLLALMLGRLLVGT